LDAEPFQSERHRALRIAAALSTHLAFVGVVGVVTFIRWRLQQTPYPTGLDGGNWLALGHAILGEHIRSASIVYAPVVPLMAVAAERLFGTYGGVQALALTASAVPAVGAYVLFSVWGLRWRAVVLAGLIASSAGTGEAMAWGGYPQLIGLGILPLFVVSLEAFLATRNLWTALPPALLLLAALATSDFVGPMTALVGLLYLVARYSGLVKKGEGNSLRHVVFGVGLSIVVALPVAPLYVGLVPGIAANERLKLAPQPSLSYALEFIGSVGRDLPTFWIAALVIAIVAPLTLLAKNRHRLALLSAAILLPSIATLVGGGEDRFAYFVSLGVVAGLGAWWELAERLPTWSRHSLNAALLTCLLIDVLVGTQVYEQQRSYYAVLNPGLVQGLTRLAAITGPREVIAVSPAPHDWELGWWVEGAAHRPAIYAGNPIWLNYTDEKIRNAIANRMFAETSFEDTERDAREAGAAYLFVDKEWSGYEQWAKNGRGINPAAIVYENESVLITSTGG
jgi:hypothetical protein